ncbi:hypothetical protein A3Q56_04604 [Intoshia linei]|uniref:RBR-type E3 ubiquitin transferase n=1 Tax=Intoshia linei TaxID=1819745 RepID=A0A177B0B1_9BILA|nr:hypothetical protein A3Q56_04604 [Intoshia linei]
MIENEMQDINILSSEDVLKLMNDKIALLCDVIQKPSVYNRAILNYSNWDINYCLDQYYSNYDQFIKNVGLEDAIVDNIKSISKMNKNFTQKYKLNEKEYECFVCCTDQNIENFLCLSCGHAACRECWNNYISSQLDERNINVMKCLYNGCAMILQDDIILQLISNKNRQNLYKKAITELFVRSNKLLCWCPKPDCTFASRIKCGKIFTIKCNCAGEYCFNCKQDNHEPLSCDLIEKWNKIVKSDLQSSLWIDSNTKKCPNCKSSIEKVGGCVRVHCTLCGIGFCWICNKITNNHYHCNVASGINPLTQNKRNETRFSTYYTKYNDERNTLKTENKYDRILNQLQTKIYFKDYDIMNTAVYILKKCRRLISNSYVFVYFVMRNTDIDIFLLNLKDLEKSVKDLSTCLDHDINCKRYSRIHLLNKYNYCNKRRKVLLDHIKEGFSKNLWTLYD